MKKALKIIFVTVFGLCLLVVAAGYIILANVDFNRYKNLIVKAVADATGRELAIGDIQLKVSFNPVIAVSDVTFSNAKWAKEPLMASAKEVSIGVAVLPLLKKSLVIDSFVISDAAVNLSENAKGEKNWDFAPAVAKVNTVDVKRFELIKSAEAAEVSAVDETAKMLSSLVVKQVSLQNVVVNYTDKAAKTQHYDITKFTLDENVSGNIDFDFDVNKGLYRGQGEMGAFDKINSREGFPFVSKLNVRGIDVATNLRLFDLLGDLRFEGKVEAQNFIGKNSGFNESVDVTLKGSLQNIKANIESFKVAGNTITGAVTADLAAKVPNVTADFNAPKIDIASFAKKQTTNAWNNFLISDAVATTLVPETTIPYDVFYLVNANVNATIGKVVNNGNVVAENVSLNTKVNGGTATLRVLKGKVSGGVLTAEAVLSGKNKSVSLNADLAGFNLQKLLVSLQATSDTFRFISGSASDVHIKLAGNGSTYNSVVDSLDGQIVAIVDKSELHLGNIGMLKGNIISQLLNALNITKGNDNLNLRCAVVRADVKNGNAVLPNGLVLNADKFTVVSNGEIDLKKDKINLSFKPFAGKLTDTNIAKALSSLVKLTGTIQNPKIGIDSANAIKTIVGVTTAGPVYLGAQMLLDNDGSPCYTALEGTGYETRFPKSSNVVTDTTGDVGKILDNSVDMVKSTTKGLLNILSGNAGKSETVK